MRDFRSAQRLMKIQVFWNTTPCSLVNVADLLKDRNAVFGIKQSLPVSTA
jgi:hypothetical protein